MKLRRIINNVVITTSKCVAIIGYLKKYATGNRRDTFVKLVFLEICKISWVSWLQGLVLFDERWRCVNKVQVQDAIFRRTVCGE
ncbi:DNA primase DnaG [Trichinella spiralis]|uniref:DNA primase DnaG n=1 Tax=Trichinella spiralis TaxID=6334 RepID=A0ABR3KXV6_TRISP